MIDRLNNLLTIKPKVKNKDVGGGGAVESNTYYSTI